MFFFFFLLFFFLIIFIFARHALLFDYFQVVFMLFVFLCNFLSDICLRNIVLTILPSEFSTYQNYIFYI